MTPNASVRLLQDESPLLETHTLRAVLRFAQGQDAAMQASIQDALQINSEGMEGSV